MFFLDFFGVDLVFLGSRSVLVCFVGFPGVGDNFFLAMASCFMVVDEVATSFLAKCEVEASFFPVNEVAASFLAADDKAGIFGGMKKQHF